jgi:DNA helicase-2/ATP-dependent DNA helicase PcrA
VTFEVLQGKDQLNFLKKIIQRLRIKNLSTAMVLREISLAKNNLISLEEFKDLYTGEETMEQVAEIFAAYEAEKKKNLLLDFDDLLLETYHLLKENGTIREKYRQTFRHLLVDEYQDLNPLQHEIIKLLTEDQTQASSLWVCGDDWQSIYAFTGATLGHILKFQEIFPEAQQYILSVNYRSTPQILEACQNLIRHNVRKIEKTLESQQENGDGVTIIEAGDEEDEALKVANELTDLTQHGHEFKDIAILYRANYQSRVMEETLRLLKIPYTIENGVNFYDRFEVKVLLEYLRLLSNPDSDEGDEALKTIINVPSRYIGRKFMEGLESFCAEKGVHLYRGLKSFPIELIYVKKRVEEFLALMDHLMTSAATLEPAEAIYILREP